ncbi:amidohydrolase family protein [Paeniglutamicibacter cryotolerans]|uniref:Imidazolonepropionase-like amidohydrolase n=1 Tax=Paeniglutamicibacter cryotolerans TaxID=670079 RepID=A0A839QK45_9MICC|nr:amidohydrolase family protein [Paeniglutamicibacter cryotolerans]MBB2996778.1 imidazolonepropionase-like amidohydrolase [Paeniglutamicibacter cryotolerans]
MHAIRVRHAYDGESFMAAGATVLIEGGLIIGVESYEFPIPGFCEVTHHEGTLLPGLIDAHTHLVTDSGVSALGRVAGFSDEEIEQVISTALHDQLMAGVTTVRDLGDRRFCVLERRDRQLSAPVIEPQIVASGPPLTSTNGHCHFLGGEVSGTEEIIRAVAERAERGADIIKVMASGGVNTPGTDAMLTQFTADELQLIVDSAHAAGVPVTAHAHGTPAVEQALSAGVDGIEHCSCVTARGFGQVSEETLAALARSRIAVCPTLGLDTHLMKNSPPEVRAMLARIGMTAEEILQVRSDFVGRLYRSGVRLVSGADSGIGPAKRHGVLPYAVCELVTAGLSVAEALATATSGAADACGVGAGKGRLAAGCDADLLVVAGDLETDVTALHRLRYVLLRGLPVSI